MTDRPILFSAPMVRALLDGRKTQTRRLARRHDLVLPDDPIPTIWQSVKPGDRLYVRETWVHTGTGVWSVGDVYRALDGHVVYRADGEKPSDKWFPSIHMPRWASRLTLHVTATKREMVQEISEEDARAEGSWPPPSVRQLRQDTTWISGQCRDCCFALPRDERSGSKIRGCPFRLGDEKDQNVEFLGQGCWDFHLRSDDTPEPHRLRFKYLWQSLHTKPGARWEDNPEVVALTFRVEQANIDRLAA